MSGIGSCLFTEGLESRWNHEAGEGIRTFDRLITNHDRFLYSSLKQPLAALAFFKPQLNYQSVTLSCSSNLTQFRHTT